MTAGDVMGDAAILLNDSERAFYTNTILLPYIKMAYRELKEFLEENNAPVTNNSSAAIDVLVGQFDIGGPTGPALPSDLIEIQGMYERADGSSDNFLPMTRREFLPHIEILIESLVYFAWQDQIIKFIGATTDREVKIDYISGLGDIESENAVITLLNSRIPLAYRTAGLAAEFVGENPTRAESLNNFAGNSLERLLSIVTKGRQVIATRHRPFRSGYKVRQDW